MIRWDKQQIKVNIQQFNAEAKPRHVVSPALMEGCPLLKQYVQRKGCKVWADVCCVVCGRVSYGSCAKLSPSVTVCDARDDLLRSPVTIPATTILLLPLLVRVCVFLRVTAAQGTCWLAGQRLRTAYIAIMYHFHVEGSHPGIRLGICQKIYMTQFSAKRILHTENA